MPRRAAVASGRVDAARGSAHAYVVFQQESAAGASLAHNMAEFEGHHLRVDLAGVNQLKVKAARRGAVDGGAAAAALKAQAPPVRYDPGRSVFVGNLHVETEVRVAPRSYLASRPGDGPARAGGRVAGVWRAVRVLQSGVQQACSAVGAAQPLPRPVCAVQDEELIRFFVSGVGAGADVELEAVRVVRDPKTSVGKGED
jgi:hypothetical protein